MSKKKYKLGKKITSEEVRILISLGYEDGKDFVSDGCHGGNDAEHRDACEEHLKSWPKNQGVVEYWMRQHRSGETFPANYLVEEVNEDDE